jgi:tubulin polyglutamylase TTLL6/13
MGYQANMYWSQIKDIIVKTLISAQPHLKNSYKAARPNDYVNDICF